MSTDELLRAAIINLLKAKENVVGILDTDIQRVITSIERIRSKNLSR